MKKLSFFHTPLSAAVMGGGIKLSAVFQMEFICNRFLSAFQFLFCNLP